MELPKEASAPSLDQFQRAFLEHYDWLFRQVESMLARVQLAPHIGADDIIQNIFLRTSASISTPDWVCPSAARCWLRRSAFSMVIEAKRAHLRQKREGNRERLAIQLLRQTRRRTRHGLFAPDRTPSSQCGRIEATRILRRALAELPEDERQILELRYIEGQTEVQIAQRVGQSRDKVRGAIARAVGKLFWSRPLRRAFLGEDHFNTPQRGR